MSRHGATRIRTEAALAAAVGAVVRRLPRSSALFLGRLLGAAWGALDARHVGIAVQNLERAFPEWPGGRARRVARDVYRHFGKVMLELLWLEGRSSADVLSFVQPEGLEHVEAARAKGRGVVFVSAHIGSWEVHGIAQAWHTGQTVAVIARALDNPHLDARLNRVRRMSGNSVLYKQRALVHVLRRLREGGSVAILVDQNVQEQDGIFVEFFGRPAATTTVAAALAVKTGCAIVTGHAELLPDGRYRAIYDPPIEWTPTGDRAADIAGLTQKMTTIIEGWIRRNPEQWLWMHRRWKTQPRPEQAREAAV